MKGLELPLALAVNLFLTLVVPTIRTYRRTGKWPVVFHRKADPFQQLMGAVMKPFLIAALVWTILFWLLGREPLAIWQAPDWLTLAGWALIGLGTLFTIVAQIHMGTSWRIGIDDRKTDLVTGGFFSIVRNPIFTGLLTSLLGVVLITPSPWTVMGFLMITTLVALQTRLEEQHLIKLHGPTYLAYAAKVGRFLPKIGRFPSPPANAAPAMTD